MVTCSLPYLKVPLFHLSSVAKLVPADEESRDLFGYMAGTIDILGDIVSPLDVEWEAMR